MEHTEDRDQYRMYLLKKRNARQKDEESIKVTLEAMNARILDYQLECELANVLAAQAEASYGEF